jgi:large subunit ribosomal protein L30e
MKSGKFTLGLKTTLKCLRSGKSELGVVRVVGGLRLLQSYFSPRRARRFAHLFSPLSPSLVPSLGKLIIVSSNIPPIRRAEIDYYAMLAKTAVHHYAGTNVELGTACGKLHRVAVLAITDPGDSDIIKLTPGAE